jgi:hypothetical protein
MSVVSATRARPGPAPTPTSTSDAAGAAWPSIALVTPSLNRAAYLEDALRSVLAQRYPRLEYVVLDGGSTDGSGEILRRYADQLGHVESGLDGGPYAAVTRGFGLTRGEIMGWLNADDRLHPGALHAVGAIFAAFPQVEWITGTPTRLDSAGRAFVASAPPRWSRLRLLSGDYRWIQQESTFWRRSLWERAGGRLETSWRLAADLELWVRFSRLAPLYSTTALLGAFRVLPDQRSRVQRAAYLAEAEAVLRAEARSPEDRAGLARLRGLRRWRAVPLVGASWRLRRALEEAHGFPPLIDFDPEAGRLVLREA